MDKALIELLEYCKSNNRVCPQPPLWTKLWELLPNRKRVGAGFQPGAPLILAAWWDSSDASKQQRLIDHVNWAYDHGGFERVDKFIRYLTEDQWYHFAE